MIEIRSSERNEPNLERLQNCSTLGAHAPRDSPKGSEGHWEAILRQSEGAQSYLGTANLNSR